ncbi:MAG: alanine--tRNA ligase-related protein [Patescibacteria group bacterium]
MNSNELRQKFLKYFEGEGHKVLPSSSLVPGETDPTVLFTTAGMHQFKRYYSEPLEAPSARVTTSQKCVRTGDIDEVGDKTHLTFFEMLGNFSFGYPETEHSYFKKESIDFAWRFLTDELGLDKKRIYATYFQGENGVAEDRESFDILKTIEGLDEIKPQGFDDNFWSLGTENSPGGPTVEFYVDGVEVWNLVFNEYTFIGGEYKPAKFKGVDTGMGFERLLCSLNKDLDSVYHTDLFDAAHKKLHELLKNEDVTAERVILDHIRAAIFIINDGVVPSNKDKGYVLRRLIRRAIVKAQQIGITENFVIKIAEQYFSSYEGVYSFDQPTILGELEKEEGKFRHTLRAGLKKFEIMKTLKENSIKSTTSAAFFNGKELFDLYQSDGFPLELSLELAKEAGLPVRDQEVELFKHLSKSHQELSRTASAGMFKGGLAEAGEITTKYHTATHLLLAALRQVLGDHVFQKGSNITAERMRFDFSHPDKMTPEQIEEVEKIVNQKIDEDLTVSMEEMSLEDAKASGAMGVFENKYGDKVKVYTIGQTPHISEVFSREMCGGPHVTRTGELGQFKISKEEASSSGVRRIKAVLK